MLSRLLPLLLVVVLCWMPGQAHAAEAPPAVAEAQTESMEPAIWISGEHVSSRWQARLMRPRPNKPLAAFAVGLGMGMVGGAVGGVIGAPLFFVGVPLVTGTLGAAFGATTGAWLFSGDAPYWFMGVGAALGVSAASILQAGLLFGSAAAAITLVGLPLAVVLAGAAVGIGLLLMPVGACFAARYHRKNPVPRVRFRPRGLQPIGWRVGPQDPAPPAQGQDSAPKSPEQEDLIVQSPSPWQAPAWQPAAAAAGWGGEQL